MSIFPSLRLRAIGSALFRRAIEAVSMGAVFLAAFFAVLSPLFFFIMMCTETALSILGVRHATIFPFHLYLPAMAASLVCALAWILRPPASAPALATNFAAPPFFQRAARACQRSIEIFNSSFAQFIGLPPLAAGDPRTSSLPSRYRSRRASGKGSIAAACFACLDAALAALIGLGLLLLASAGSIGFLAFIIPAKIQMLSAASPLLAARQWAAQLSERLEAEGFADLAASEASFLDREVPASAKPAKSPRL